MKTPFARWSDRIAAATDERSRRQLLAEIGAWRARNLGDVTALREGAFAMASLYELLGEAERAAQEAGSLVSLCLTSPEAPRAQTGFARSFVERLTHRGARRAQAPAQRHEPAAEGGDGIDEVVTLGDAGRLSEARARLKDARGARARVAGLWLDALAILAMKPDARTTALQEFVARLRPHTRGEGREAERERPADVRTARAETRTEGPLVALIGEVPSKRDPRVRAIEAWLSENPSRADELASAALADHVQSEGLRAPAPWLVGVVGRALAAEEGAPLTVATLDDLRRRGSFAVTAYADQAFVELVAVLRAGLADGWDFLALRRGVLPKDEPGEERVWTLRISKNFTEGMVARAPSRAEALSTADATRIARRIAELSGRATLVALGDTNAPLRDAARAAGVTVVESGAPSDVLAALEALPAAAERPRRERPEKKEPAEKPERAPRERAPRAEGEIAARGPHPLDELRNLFAGEPDPSADDLRPHVKALRRAYKAFSAVRDAWEAAPAAQADTRLASLLRVVHDEVPAGVRLAEGVTLALRTAARLGGTGAVVGVLEETGIGERFAGPGWRGAVALIGALEAEGFVVQRILRGLSRREKDNNPALAVLGGDNLDGFWRLLVSQDERRGEIWWFDAPSPEARAAAPQLLLEAHQRAVVGAEGQDFGWYDALRGPKMIVWDASGAEGLRGALSTWIAVAPRSDAGEES
jgi:hypothetical protein